MGSTNDESESEGTDDENEFVEDLDQDMNKEKVCVTGLWEL